MYSNVIKPPPLHFRLDVVYKMGGHINGRLWNMCCHLNKLCNPNTEPQKTEKPVPEKLEIPVSKPPIEEAKTITHIEG